MTDKQLPEELHALREDFRAKGLLLKATTTPWIFERERRKWWFVFLFHRSTQGTWESFKANGVVQINYFAIQRIVVLAPDKSLRKGYQLVIGPLLFSWALWPIERTTPKASDHD